MRAFKTILTIGGASVIAFASLSAYTLYKDQELRNKTKDSLNNFKHAINDLENIFEKKKILEVNQQINNAIKSKEWKQAQWSKLP